MARKNQSVRSKYLMKHPDVSNYHWYIGEDNRARLCDCFKVFAVKERLNIRNGYRFKKHKPKRQHNLGTWWL